ncbi:MAG: glycosyltransferase family 4 protein [Thermoleophilia bacterium]
MAKVLIHSMIFAPDGVSTAYLYSDLASKLKELGHSITVLTTTPHFNVLETEMRRQPMTRERGNWLYFSEFDGIPVWHITMPKKSGDNTARMRSIIKFHLRALQFGLFSREKYDIILSPSPPLTIGAVSWLLAKRMHAKSIYNVQEIYPDFAIDQGVITNRWVIWLLRRLEKFVYSKSTRVVTIGERFRRIIASRGLPEHKLLTIPNFVDTDVYQPMPRDNPFAREHGLLDKFVIMYAGNIGLAQDWEALFYAAEVLGDLPVCFVIIGGGSRRKWLEDELIRRNARNILLLDYQPRERMSQINSSCDLSTILMNPKVTDDGFPSKIYTTLACGKPTIVCCDDGSELITIIRESRCGEWIKSGDFDGYVMAIRSYFNQRERLVAEGKIGRAFVMDHYSKDIIASKYDCLLNDLASG